MLSLRLWAIGVAFSIGAFAFGPAYAAECDIAHTEFAPLEVIGPCTKLLEQPQFTATGRAKALFARGRAYHRSFQLEYARSDYTLALDLTPLNEEILLARSNVNLRLGNRPAYVADVRRAARVNPGSASVLRALGVLAFNAGGDIDQAIKFYTEALEIDPEEPFALMFRAERYRHLRKFEQALADVEALVRITVTKRLGYLDEDSLTDFHATALIQRAHVLEAAGQTERAERDYDAAIAREPSVTAFAARAEFYLTIKDDKEAAVNDLKFAAERAPRNARVQYALGMAHVYLKQFDEAFAAFNNAVAARPTHGSALEMRAKMHRQFGRTELAVRDFTAAMKVDPHLMHESLPAMRHAGYWTAKGDPTGLTPAFEDAIRACMIDVTCN